MVVEENKADRFIQNFRSRLDEFVDEFPERSNRRTASVASLVM